MTRRLVFGIGFALCLAVVACGTNNGTTSRKAHDGILLRASDLPSLRLVGEDPAPDAAALADILGGHESCLCASVFKSKSDVVTVKLRGLGFKRGLAELWNGAGLQGGAFATEFDTEAHAKAALTYMKTELFMECPGNPYCSKRVEIKSPGIPDFVGQAFTPLRPKEAGPESTIYKFLFRIGTGVYGVLDGATDAYDPGSVSQAQALALVQRFDDRVKKLSIEAVLRRAPATPLGPGSGPPPEGGPPPPA